MRRQFTSEQDQFIRQKYETGFRLTDIARHYGVTAPTVKAAVLRAGGKMRSRHCKRLSYGRRDILAMVRDRQDGMSYAKIGEKYGCSDVCVFRYMRMMRQSEMITAGAIRQSRG